MNVFRFVVAAALFLGLSMPELPAAAHPAMHVTSVQSPRASWDSAPPQVRYGYSAAAGADQPGYHFREESPDNYVADSVSGFRTFVSVAGMRVESGERSWTTVLTTIGRAAIEPVPVSGREVRHDEPNRVEARGGSVSSWYVNGPLGLERGWTVREHLADSGPLKLAFTSDRDVEASADGHALAVLDENGDAMLRERGLLAFDAKGHSLAIRYRSEPSGYGIEVDDAGAAYPLTIDPFLQTTELTATGSANKEYLGQSVAISSDGGTVIAGAPLVDTNGSATGVSQGAIFVFLRPGAVWGAFANQTAKLTASDGTSGDVLGSSVAISSDGSTIVAGAPSADTNGNSPGGDQGAVYVFVRPAAGWASGTQTAKLTATDVISGELLGSSVDVSPDGGTVIAGAPRVDTNGGAVSGTYQGAVYVFTRPGGGWSGAANQSARLTNSNAADGDGLGSSVALSADGKTIAGGSGDADTNGGTSGDGQGEVCVFVRSGAAWTSTANPNSRLRATVAAGGDNLGASVAISAAGDVIVAGAPNADTDGGGPGVSQGTVYVFNRAGANWALNATESAKLLVADPTVTGGLGGSVTMSGDGSTIVAGAAGTDTDGAGPNTSVGAAYVFYRTGSAWGGTSYPSMRLTSADGASFDAFGSSVALSADQGTLVIGAYGVDTNGSASGNLQGAAYLYSVPKPAPTTTTIATLSANPIVAGQSLSVSFTVTSTTGAPAGTVEVSNGVATCTATVAAGSCALPVATPGTSGVVARYFGSSDHLPSASTARQLTALGAPGSVQALGSTPTLVGNPTLFAVVNLEPGVTYQWDFGDSTNGTGAVATHTYAVVGDYTATVSATNAAGTQSATVLVSVVRPGSTSFIALGVIQAGGW